MSVEIERKYLITNDDWRTQVKKSLHIVQGYIKSADATVRLRCYIDEDQRAEITIKGKREGITRLEFEYPVPYEEAREMQQKLCQERLVEKTRHLIEYDGMVWELDEFHGDNEGLFVAEVEMTNEHQHYELPSWAGADVSFESKYRNSKLCVKPYKDWSE